MLSVIMLSFKLRVAAKSTKLSIIMLSVVMLNAVMLSIIMLSAVMLNVVMLSVVMLNVVMLIVMAHLLLLARIRYILNSEFKGAVNNHRYSFKH